MMEFDLKKLMETQEDLHPDLVPYLEEDLPIEGMSGIRHPLVYSVPHFPNMNALVNFQYLFNTEKVIKYIDEKEWTRAITLVARPYRPNFLYDHCHELDDKDYWELVEFVWTDSENIIECHDIWKELLFDADRLPTRSFMMDEKDIKALDELPDEIKVYRGVNKSYIHGGGYSWTTDIKIAEFFAGRFTKEGEGPGRIIHGTIKKSDVVAYLLGRGESEIVADWQNVVIQKYQEYWR